MFWYHYAHCVWHQNFREAKSGITKWWYQLNTRTNQCWMLNDCWAIIYNFNEQSWPVSLLVKCKVTLLGGVTLFLLRKHIIFIFISPCKVLPNLAEWWSYGLCIIFHNLVYESFIHRSPVLDLCWVTQSLKDLVHSLTSSHPRVMSLSRPISGPGWTSTQLGTFTFLNEASSWPHLSPKKLDLNSEALI